MLASWTRRLVGLRGLNTQTYPTGFTVRDNTPPVAWHSAVAFSRPEPGPVTGGVLVLSQLAWMSGSGAGPWQVSMPSPPSRLSWLPSLEGPMRVSLPHDRAGLGHAGAHDAVDGGVGGERGDCPQDRDRENSG